MMIKTKKTATDSIFSEYESLIVIRAIGLRFKSLFNEKQALISDKFHQSYINPLLSGLDKITKRTSSLTRKEKILIHGCMNDFVSFSNSSEEELIVLKTIRQKIKVKL